jgi:hypothetical protein
MLEALRRRGLDDSTDLELLHLESGLRDQLETIMAAHVAALRGYPRAASWQEIGVALGVTRQTAQERYRKAGGIRRPGGQEAKYR